MSPHNPQRLPREQTPEPPPPLPPRAPAPPAVRPSAGPLPHKPRYTSPDVHIDTPSHTPRTRKGEEAHRTSPEKGRVGTARNARSSTSINPSLREPIDPRMPHLPPA